MLNYYQMAGGNVARSIGPYAKGRLPLSTLGYSTADLVPTGGQLRLVFELSTTSNNYFDAPAMVFTYKEPTILPIWRCEFNGSAIIENIDHDGLTTLIWMDRDKLARLENLHKNTLSIQAEFVSSTKMDARKCYMHIFK